MLKVFLTTRTRGHGLSLFLVYWFIRFLESNLFTEPQRLVDDEQTLKESSLNEESVQLVF